MEILYTISLSTILGWLLGILSPTLTDKIENARKRKELKKIIIHDLTDIKKRLVMIPFLVYSSYGDLDEDKFNWVKKYSNDFKILASDEDTRKKYEELTSKKDIDLSYWNSNFKRQDPAWQFKKMNTSIMDSYLLQFELLDDSFLVKLLEIRFHINAFNEEVASAKEYLKMTFDSSISTENGVIIKKEIDNKNYLISKKAILIVEKISQVVENADR